jgi:hypothetical protein
MTSTTISRRRRSVMAALAAVPAVAFGAGVLPASAQAAEPAYYQVVNRYNDKCLAVADFSYEHAAPVRTDACNGGDNQLWYRQSAGTFDGKAYYYIKARHSGMCLNVGYYGQADGDGVVQATCTNSTNEQWSMNPVRDAGYVQLIARHSLKCLDKTAWDRAVQWRCWGNAEEWQHWRFAYIGGTP